MGQHQRKITTTSPEAQRYFDQGLIWAFAFNHDEAIRSFEQAARLDPDCAMAWWGVALCHGPHINNPIMPPEREQAAWAALQRAQERQSRASAVEQALIAALAKRYAEPAAKAERRPLDEAYAEAMRGVWKANRDDPDIGVLYAESLMDLQPWDLWTLDGKAKGATTEILAVLEAVLAKWPEHPGACHLYIHAQEAGPHPEKAEAAAKVLRTAVPIAGHLVHMPAHIDVQVGRWARAADQNQAAIDADRRYRALSPKQGFYNVYMAHNRHFLAFAAMMEGQSAVALQAAREMIAGVPEVFLKEQPALIDPYLMVEMDVLKRFGRWDEVLAYPRPAETLPITTAYWHYARGVAYAAQGDLPAAEGEQKKFRAAVEKVPTDALMAINKAHAVLTIAEQVLAGEIALARRDTDQAVAALRTAVRLEDELMYMEPPEWIQPARHTLGAVLVDAKRYAEAEKVYRADLEKWPENGWSLHGLAASLRGQGANAEAEKVQTRFEKTWARADTKIAASCLCVNGEASR
jgi:tetratricopeptide (TPR) repeat protein